MDRFIQLKPALEQVIGGKLREADSWRLHSDTTDPDQQTLLFHYPSAMPTAGGGYVRQTVKIEMGARADHWPCEARSVTPYVAEELPQAFQEPHCAVKVLSAERTFWEKATILHAEFHRPVDKAIPERFSRHYCDFYEMIRRGVDASAVAKLDLLARVAQHKSLFFRTSWAHYAEAVKGSLRIMPPEHRLKALRDDHAKMRQMFFGEPPVFGEILALLRQWELEFNQR